MYKKRSIFIILLLIAHTSWSATVEGSDSLPPASGMICKNLLSWFNKVGDVDDGIVAVKSPAEKPILNFAWIKSGKDIPRLRGFYGSYPFFTVFSDPTLGVPISAESGVIKFTLQEMVLDLRDYPKPKVIEDGLTVTEVSSPKSVRVFAELTNSIKPFSVEEIEKFVTPCIVASAGKYYLLTLHEKPISIVYTYIDEHKCAGIYLMGTAKDQQKKGYGKRLIEESLWLATQDGATHAALYVKPDIAYFYRKSGFQAVGEFDVYANIVS
jgi:Acetyltransferase (GNAT) domain